jgi:hypothetical protein
VLAPAAAAALAPAVGFEAWTAPPELTEELLMGVFSEDEGAPAAWVKLDPQQAFGVAEEEG